MCVCRKGPVILLKQDIFQALLLYPCVGSVMFLVYKNASIDLSLHL